MSSSVSFSERLQALRDALDATGVDAFLLPRADQHLGEYLPESEERLRWLTGFTGSMGVALVTKDQALLFVDGRYTLQAADQLDGAHWAVEHLIQTPPASYIEEHLKGAKVAFDPRLHSISAARRLEKAATSFGGELVPLTPNPIDALWDERPAAPQEQVVSHPLCYSGQSHAEKIAALAQSLQTREVEATILNQLDSIAWLFNIRGSDMAFTPLATAYAFLHADGTAELFLDPAKIDESLRDWLGNGVALRPFEEVGHALEELGQTKKTVSLDPASCSAWVRETLSNAGAEIQEAEDPVMLPRALKNPVEISGTRAAHIRDAAAVARFLHWLDVETPGGHVDEIAAEEALQGFRSALPLWRGPSFSTISGAGPNGAIVHYHATPETSCKLEAGSLYLVDSGAQFLDGTTDITRTIAIGEPDEEMRCCFTLVLKGHIALATARVPVGTSGVQLDALARQHLWREGLDFDHGTGHGVGSYLGVHEGPQRISSQGRVEIKPGMIISNEPGYYKTGAFGIRLENLVIAVESRPNKDSGKQMLSFETITFAPFDRRCIEVSLLDKAERDWLNHYHAIVKKKVSFQLKDAATLAWLEAACAPI